MEDRPIPGHWEGKLRRGSNNCHIATLVERRSCSTAFSKVPSNDTAALVAALTRHVRKLPVAQRRSLTWDRGLKMLAIQKAWANSTKELTKLLEEERTLIDGGDGKHSYRFTGSQVPRFQRFPRCVQRPNMADTLVPRGLRNSYRPA